MKHSLEYCSLNYLNMWLKNDKIYNESLQNGTREERLITIKNAANTYRIARNLPTEYDEGNRYEPVLKIIDKVKVEDFSGNSKKVIESIRKVEKKISNAYGQRGVLSLTTKILWLKVRSPILIYDAQARKALDTDDGDLSSFYEKWKDEYEKYSKNIDTVCGNLSKVAKYSCDQNIATTSYVKEISEQVWFRERVFDLYLWHKGLP